MVIGVNKDGGMPETFVMLLTSENFQKRSIT